MLVLGLGLVRNLLRTRLGVGRRLAVDSAATALHQVDGHSHRGSGGGGRHNLPERGQRVAGSHDPHSVGSGVAGIHYDWVAVLASVVLGLGEGRLLGLSHLVEAARTGLLRVRALRELEVVDREGAAGG